MRPRLSLAGDEVEADEHPLCVGQIADQAAEGQGQFLDQGWRGNDLLPPRQSRLLVEVDHLQVIAPFEVLFADLGNVGDRPVGLKGAPGDVETEDIVFPGRIARLRWGLNGHVTF